MNIVRIVPNFANHDQVLQKYCRKNFKAPCSIELVYLPFVLFKYRIDLTTLFGRKKTEKGLFLVDLLQGIPINIRRNTSFDFKGRGIQEEFEGLIGTDPVRKDNVITVTIEPHEVDQEQVLPVVLDTDTAVKRGRNLLMYDIMRLTGALRYRRVDIVPEPGTKTVYVPYWMIYYRDRKNQMKFDVLDALSGQKEGGQIIKSIKIGLVAKHKNEDIGLQVGGNQN
jgi:hypothetical protein